jgi:carbon-monoxide dehydrogenase medium subunit
MIPAAFDYVRPVTLDDAIRELAAHDGDTKVLAGGQSILPLLKLRLATAGRLVDIGRLAELKGVRTMADGGLAVGALTTYAELMDSPVMGLALMADALPNVGDIQVRNRGTLGGAIAHADPASDMPAVLLALDAVVVARSPEGERTIPIGGLFEGPFQTSLGEHEILTEIRLPAPSGSYGSAYVALEQPASGYSIVGAAVVVGRTSGGRGPMDDVRVALTGVGPVAYRAGAVESALVAGADAETAASHAIDGVSVASDIHADREYRSSMAVVYTRRAIEKALARLG